MFGVEFVKRGFKVLKFAIKSLTALGNEMFRLTNATKGGLLLMLIFFYSAFVMGTTLWIETGGDDPACDSFQMCTYTMMRLTFYDGTGFDFTYSLTSKHRFLFFLCIVYMCLTSFGILNGLVGIFGTAFSAASDDAFNDSDDEEEIENDDGEEPDDQDLKDVYTSFRGMYTDDNNNNNNNNHNASGYNGPRRGSKPGLFHPNNDLGEELYKQVDDDDSSEVSEMGEKIQPLASNTKQPSMSKMEVKALQQRLKGALGAKSNFAMMELTKMAQEPPVKKPAPPRRTLRDIIQANKIGQGTTANVHPVLGSLASPDRPPLYAPEKTKPAAGAGASHHHIGMAGMFGTPKKQKNLHAAVGMFASLKKQKSAKGLHHAASNGGHNSSSGPNSGPFRDYLLAQQAHAGDHRGSGVANTAEVKAINASVHHLQRTVETQSQTMSVLIKHIEFLSQQLYDLNPTIVAKPIVISVPDNETKPPPRKFSNVFVSPRVSADKVPTSAPESIPQTPAEPPVSVGSSPAKSMAWGLGLKAAFTKSPPSSNNSSMYAMDKPTPLHAPKPVQVPDPVPVAAVGKVTESASAPAPTVVVPAFVPAPVVAPVVHVVAVHPAHSAVPAPEPVLDTNNNNTKEAPKPTTQPPVSPWLEKSQVNNALTDNQDKQGVEVVHTAGESSSPATLTEIVSRTSPVPVMSMEETHSPAVSPHTPTAHASAPAAVSVPEPMRELSDSSALDSLSLSKDTVYRGPGIELPKIVIGGEAAGLYSPVWTPANITNKNKNEAAGEESAPAPVASPSRQNSRSTPDNQGQQSREENKSPSDSVKSAHRHRRNHAPGNRTSTNNNNSQSQSQNSPAPSTPNSSSGMSILGAMGKFKPQKANPLDEFASSALSKSPTVLDLPENEGGGSQSDIWNPHNRPSTSPFKVHRQDARPSTTPNTTSTSLEGFHIRGGNQHGELGAADGARAGAGERRANTGNGWLTEFSQKSTVGPDDVIEMPGTEQNV